MKKLSFFFAALFALMLFARVGFAQDANGKFTFPDGKTENRDFKKGFFGWVPETTHQGENVGDKLFKLIQIEMKNKKK